MIQGTEIRDFLAYRFHDPEQSKSSHWTALSQRASYNTESGVTGVEGLTESSRVGKWSQFYHDMMQRPILRTVKDKRRFREVRDSCKRISSSQGRPVDLAAVFQILPFLFVEANVPEFGEGKVSLVIGDGRGVLSGLIHQNTRNRIITVNLQQALLVDYVSSRGFASDQETVLVEEDGELANVLANEAYRYIMIRADNHRLIREAEVHTAFAINCLQEMNPSDVSSYFQVLRNGNSSDTYFYCVNRVEKRLHDGTLNRFSDYPWERGDQLLADEPCPWYTKYYTSRPPFYREYDGPVVHRLARWSRE